MGTININNLSLNHINLLNEICEEFKEDYHKLVESIYKETDGSLDWLVSSLLSRNIYMSNLFTDLCYMELIKLVVKKEFIKLVIVKTTSQKIVLTKYFNIMNKKVLVKCSETNFSRIKIFLLPFYFILRNIYTSICLIIVKNPARLKSIDNIIGIKLLDIYFINSMFKDGVFSDRYYNGLSEHLNKEEKKSLFFVPTLTTRNNLKEIINICVKSEKNFLFKFDLLHYSDYLFALLSPIRIKKISFNDFKFNGMNIGPILKADYYRNISNESSFEGILNYLFFKRLKESGFKLLLVVNWFENQVVDRGFNKGVRDFFPQVCNVGYQGFIIPYNFFLHFQPSQLEYETGVIPNEIAVVGVGLKNNVRRFCPQIEVKIAPAFRYSNMYLQNFEVSKNMVRAPEILVTLPLSLDESLDIISLLINVEKSGLFQNIQVKIVPHPAFNINNHRKSKRTILEKFKVVYAPFSDLISKANSTRYSKNNLGNMLHG